MIEDKPRVHFIGIGGIGMSYLARYFISQNWAVSGSDRSPSSLTRKLREEGVQVKIGHKKANIGPKTLLVVTSQAIPADNPEVMEAYRLELPVTPFPKIVGGLTSSYDTIAVAGAHGKSTTTSLVSLILIEAGLDPTVMVGTKLKELPQENFRAGRSSYLVLEADEFGRAFLNYSPAVAVVTCIDREHLDVYKDISDIKTTFLNFLSRTKRGGGLVLNADDKNLFSLKKQISVLAQSNHYKVVWYSMKNAEAKKIERILKVPGRHNVSNALAALNVAQLLGVKDEKIFSAIGNYSGSWRRMEYKGRFEVDGLRLRSGKNGAKSSKNHNLKAITYDVYDDYAHHPTEIKATLGAFKEKYLALSSKALVTEGRPPLVCIFQPHQEKRLMLLFEDFVGAFTNADVLVLLPMYKVAGRETSHAPLPAKVLAAAEYPAPHTDSKALFAAIKKKYPRKAVFYLDNPKNIKKELIKILHDSFLPLPRLSASGQRQSAVLVMMGAGDIFEYTKNLVS
jgi:UDP-N-acetylmuramate--alanine ligase